MIQLPKLLGGSWDLSRDLVQRNFQDTQDAINRMTLTGTLLTRDPVNPQNDTFWVVREGTSPNMSVSLKGRIAGITYTIAGITL